MGRLFVELADPAALGEQGTSSAALHGLAIRAGQSYEASLAEVRAHFDLPPFAYRVDFAESRRGKRYVVAPSAWDEIEPDSDLVLVVSRKEKQPGPAAQPEGRAEPAAQRSSSVGPPPPQQGRALQPRSSQQSEMVIPATPEHTDNDDDTVSDSDNEANSALRRTGWGINADEEDTPRQKPCLPPVSSDPVDLHRDRRRSPSPSPSNHGTELYVQEQWRIKSENAAADAAAAARRAIPPPPPLPVQPQAGPSHPRPSSQLSSPPRAPRAPQPPRKAATRFNSKPPPTSTTSPSSAQRQAGPPSAQPVPAPSPPSPAWNSAFQPDTSLGSESEASWACGLNSAGEFDFVPRSPKRRLTALEKGKGRAVPTPTPEPASTVAEAEAEEPAVKPEPCSSPVRSPQVGTSSGSTSRSFNGASSVTVPTVPIAQDKLSSSRAQSAHAGEAFTNLQSGQGGPLRRCHTQPSPTSSVAAAPPTSESRRRKEPTASPSRPGKRASLTSAGSPARTSPKFVLDVPVSSPRRATSSGSSSTSARRQSDGGASTSTSESAPPSATLPSPTLTHSQIQDIASRAVQSASQPNPAASASAIPPAKNKRLRSSASFVSSPNKKRKLSRNECAALAAAGERHPLPGTSSPRLKMYIRFPYWPVTPKNDDWYKAGLTTRVEFVHSVSARGHGDLAKLTLDGVFADAVEASGWKLQDMRFTLCSGTAKETTVWGCDARRGGSRTLGELGCESGQAIEVEYVSEEERRSFLAEQ
ncbi:hypothetical protein JCM10213_000822 [Rhodosporidiobolus nylandii]